MATLRPEGIFKDTSAFSASQQINRTLQSLVSTTHSLVLQIDPLSKKHAEDSLVLSREWGNGSL